MSSKQASVNLTPAMLANIKSTMKNLEGFSVNWAGVKDETGVSSNGNAAQGFRNAMKALGLKVIDSKNWKFADIDDDAAAAATDSPAKAPGSGKKRGRPKKVENGDSASPDVKRQKKDKQDTKVQVKQEADGDEMVAEAAEGAEVEDK